MVETEGRGVESYSRISGVEKATHILDLLAKTPRGLTVTAIAERLGIGKPHVSRILFTLREANYVTFHPETRAYTLSWRFIGLVLRYADTVSVQDAVQEVLESVARESGEMTQFAIVENDELVYIAKAEGHKPLQVASMLGRTAPLHATAAGKVWLASLPEDEAMAIVLRRGMPAITEATITDPIQFIEELRKVRRQGYALAWEEINRTVVGVATPVISRGRVTGALVVTIPVFEATEERIEEVRRIVGQGAEFLSDRMLAVI